MFPKIHTLQLLLILSLFTELTICIHIHPTDHNTFLPESSQDTIDGYWDAFNYFDNLYPDQSTTKTSNHGSSTSPQKIKTGGQSNKKKKMRPLSEAERQKKIEYNRKYKKDLRERKKLGLPRINEEKRDYKIHNKEAIREKRKEIENKASKKYYKRKSKDSEWMRAKREANDVRRKALKMKNATGSEIVAKKHRIYGV